MRIPFAWFHEEVVANFKEEFPEFTVVRKERNLGKDEIARLKLDRSAQQVEQGHADEASYQERRLGLIEALATEHEGKTFRSPRLGVEGCCGRGCNGCLHFWYDERYARARELHQQKSKNGA